MKGYKFLLAKAYFDKGFSLMNYLKYALALILVKVDLKTGFILGACYAILCYVIGRIWYKTNLIDTENEIGNIFNPFQREVRKKLKIKNSKKFK